MAIHVLASVIAGACGGGPVPAFVAVAGTYESTNSLPDDASFSLTFNTDGSVAFGGEYVSQDAPAGAADMWWTIQPTTGIGTGKYVRLSHTGGTDLNLVGSLNSDQWYEISSARAFGIENATGNFALEFSYDGANVDTSAAIVLTATSS